MKNRKLYLKGLDENLCSFNGFQYAVGETYTAETEDPFHWIHFAKKMTDAFRYGARIVEVEPLTDVNRYGTYADMNAKSVRIVRELSRDEIMARLLEEKCSVYKLTPLKPTYAELADMKITNRDRMTICREFTWLSAEEKTKLLPKCWKNRILMSKCRSDS